MFWPAAYFSLPFLSVFHVILVSVKSMHATLFSCSWGLLMCWSMWCQFLNNFYMNFSAVLSGGLAVVDNECELNNL